MNKKVFLLLLILIVFIISSCIPQDNRCEWVSGECKNICQSQNYFFDKVSGICKQYIEPDVNKGCCTPPPFETLDECKQICE